MTGKGAGSKTEQKILQILTPGKNMVYRSFQDLIDNCCTGLKKKRVAVAGAADEHVLASVAEADRRGIAEPILIGNRGRISGLLTGMGISADRYEISDPAEEDRPMPEASAAGEMAVGMVREGHADFIMKGMVETRDILKPLVKRENGLHTGRTMCVFSYNEIPQMNRLMGIADGGMVISPTLEQKRDIILNCTEILHRLGVEEPVFALLAAVEKANPKLPATTDALQLVGMNRSGGISGCRLVGPVSFDIAMSREIAERKGYDCPYCGDFDGLIVPDMTAGNLMHKAMIVCGGTKMAGIIAGAKVPVVLTSRGASAEEKFVSIALAAASA